MFLFLPSYANIAAAPAADISDGTREKHNREEAHAIGAQQRDELDK